VVAGSAGKVVGAVADVSKAKIEAKAQVDIARIAASASKYTTSVDEASEILSVLDRPCVRISIPDPDLSVTMDLSILSFMGGMAVVDLWKGYQELWNTIGLAAQTAGANTTQMISLAGTVPIDPRALAILSGVLPQGEESSPVTMTNLRKVIESWGLTLPE